MPRAVAVLLVYLGLAVVLVVVVVVIADALAGSITAFVQAAPQLREDLPAFLRPNFDLLCFGSASAVADEAKRSNQQSVLDAVHFDRKQKSLIWCTFSLVHSCHQNSLHSGLIFREMYRSHFTMHERIHTAQTSE